MDRSMQSLPPYVQHTSIQDKPKTRRSSAFDFRADSNVCPTCRGTGKVPKGQQEELVALIPYGDKRLKPKRTTCVTVVIFILIIIIMVIAASLLAVFLSPRDVTLVCSKVLVTNWTDIVPIDIDENDEDAENVHMTLQVHGMTKNNNYASIKVKSVNVTLSRDGTIVGYAAAHKQFSVSARQSKEVVIEVNATYSREDSARIRISCNTWGQISLEITLVSSYRYISHTSNTDDASHHYLPCNLDGIT